MSAQLLVIVLAHALTQHVRGGAESDADCSRKVFNCIQCSTDSGDAGASVCRDPFDKALRREVRNMRRWRNELGGGALARYNISTVLCDGFCVKWVRASLSGKIISIVRTCSTSMDIRFAQNSQVCIHESRTGSGTLCFCKDSMCNAASTRDDGCSAGRCRLWLTVLLSTVTIALAATEAPI